MRAMNLKPGDEVLTTPHTFVATTEAIVLAGGTPVFVDIDPDTYNMDPILLEAAITGKTRAIVPVSLYGQCANMDAINAIAHKHGLPVIEDAAQSFGAYTAKVSYGKTNTEVKAYNVGVDYALSKRTQVGVAYRVVDLTGTTQDVKQLGVGITHRF